MILGQRSVEPYLRASTNNNFMQRTTANGTLDRNAIAHVTMKGHSEVYNQLIAASGKRTETGNGLVVMDKAISGNADSVVFKGKTEVVEGQLVNNDSVWTTPVWNQLVADGDFGGIITITNAVVTADFLGTAITAQATLIIRDSIKASHKTLFIFNGSAKVRALSIRYRNSAEDYTQSIVTLVPTNTGEETTAISTAVISPGPAVDSVIQIVHTKSTTVNTVFDFSFMVFDLTEMFGAGNEPATVEEFKSICLAWGKDLDEYQPYDTGTPLGGTVDLSAIKLNGINDTQDTFNSQDGKLTRRFGERAYQTGDEDDTDVITDGTTTVYPLASPVESTITSQPITLQTGYNQLLQTEGSLANTEAEATYNATEWTQELDSTHKYFHRGDTDSIITNQSSLAVKNTEKLTDLFFTSITATTPQDFITQWNDRFAFDYDDCSVTQGKIVDFMGTKLISTNEDGTEQYEVDLPSGLKSAGSVFDTAAERVKTSKVSSIDLGTLTWQYITETRHERFVAKIEDIKTATLSSDIGNIMSSGLMATSVDNIYLHLKDKTIGVHYNTTQIWVFARGYSTVEAFKTAMSGVYLYYEKATPTTESALPINYKAYPNGTERIVIPDGVESTTFRADIDYRS